KREGARQCALERSRECAVTPEQLAADGLVLRPLSLDDALALHVAHADPEVHHFWSGPAHADIHETREKIADWISRDNVETWAITEENGPTPRVALGRITLMLHRTGVGEIGIIM